MLRLDRVKISHKIIVLIALAVALFIVFGGWLIVSGRRQVAIMENVYQKKLVPLDSLRHIQLIIREMEYRMTGVIADVLPSIASAPHLNQSVEDMASIWKATRGDLGNSPMISEFDEGMKRLEVFRQKLAYAYLEEETGIIIALYEEDWLDFKMKLYTSIDDLASAQFEKVNDYYNQIQEEQARLNKILALVLICSAAVFVVLGYVTLVSIGKPINSMVDAAALVAEGDFTHEVQISGRDEMGRMADSINGMIGRLRESFKTIASHSELLHDHAKELTESSEEMLKGANQQTAQIEQVVTSSTEMSQTILDMAKNTGEAASVAGQSSGLAREGRKVVQEAVQSILRLVESVQEAGGAMEALGKGSREIGDIVTVIQDIADQTNLLALNAAIEAARAGEQGRGFAVVADEVRKLAEKTSRATGEISDKISNIQRETESTIGVMKSGRTIADEAVESIKKSDASLQQIVAGSDAAMDMIQRIASATEQQSSAAEEVSQSMEDVAKVIARSSELARQVKLAAEGLLRIADALTRQAESFKT